MCTVLMKSVYSSNATLNSCNCQINDKDNCSSVIIIMIILFAAGPSDAAEPETGGELHVNMSKIDCGSSVWLKYIIVVF